MRDRRAAGLLAAGLLALMLVIGSCAAGGLAARAGALPAFDWQIPIGRFRVLAVHNGPVTACHPRSFRDSCHLQVLRHDFSVSYIAPDAGRTLVSFDTEAAR